MYGFSLVCSRSWVTSSFSGKCASAISNTNKKMLTNSANLEPEIATVTDYEYYKPCYVLDTIINTQQLLRLARRTSLSHKSPGCTKPEAATGNETEFSYCSWFFLAGVLVVLNAIALRFPFAVMRKCCSVLNFYCMRCAHTCAMR